jgi:glycosyltransferase involved in cell wall biosynthesis
VGLFAFFEGVGGTVTWSNGLYNSLNKNDVEVIRLNAHHLLHLNDKFDVLHFATTSPEITTLVFLHKLLARKIIFTLHGNYKTEFKATMNQPDAKKYIISWNMMLRLSNHVTCPSIFMSKFFKEVDVIIPNGLNINTYRDSIPFDRNSINGCSDATFVVLSSYNLDSPWRLKEALNTIKIFRKFHLNVRNSMLLVAGGGKYTEFLRSQTRDTDNIKFLGYVNNMPALYKTANVFLHVSSIDNLPYVILESTASGLPIVSSKTGGIPELIEDGKTGFLIEYNDIDKYIDALMMLKMDDQLINRMGSLSIKRSQKYDWSHVVKRFISLYSS